MKAMEWIVMGVLFVFSAPLGGVSAQDLDEFKKEQKQKSQEFLNQEALDGQEFMKTLVGKTKSDKLDAIKILKTEQYQKNCAFRADMNAKRRVFIEGRLAGNPKVTPKMKGKMLARLESEFEGFKAFHEQKFAENMAFLETMKRDPRDGSELEKAISEFFQKQKAEAKQYLESQQLQRPSPGAR